MIKIENTEVFGWEAAIRGMRNPMNSWDKSDSYWTHIEDAETGQTAKFEFFVGENDLDLMKRLSKAGNDHAKYLRMLNVTLDITAPLYWWKEFDTYKVGTVANSCSTMHKIHTKPFERDDFSHDRMTGDAIEALDALVAYLEAERVKFCENKDDRSHWHNIIQLLPSSFNQMRTVTLNYENLIGIYYARRTHKLAEWHTLCDWIMSLPYANDLIAVKE